MPEPTPLDSRDALLRLLTLRGVGSAGQILGDRISPTAGAQDLTEALRWAGIPARVVEAGAVDLPRLDCPTLVQARSGGWFVLSSREGLA